MKRQAVVVLLTLALAGILAGCATTATKPLVLTTVRISPSPSLPPNSGTGIDVLGASGLLLSSPDGGATWQTHAVESTISADGLFWRVAAADSQHLWAIDRTRGEIVASSDGGKTWATQYSRTGVALMDIACSDPRHAWVVGFTAGSHPLILGTTDGGTTWVRQDAGFDHAAISGVAFSGARQGWAVGHISSVTGLGPSFVLKTKDGGAHWHEVYRASAGGLGAIAATDAHHCWVVGSSSTDAQHEFPAAFIVATKDGGAHWQTQSSNGFEGLFSVSFADRLHGWAAGYKGTILATADGGRTWATQQSGSESSIYSVACDSATRAWAIMPGTSTLYSTRDGGSTWTAIRLTRPGRFGFWALSVPVADRAR
jgi:photosystem II stability/assembly factor-like uncharacterized protein